MEIGDKVRFLNDVGGGVVVGFQEGGVVVVRDADGFDLPVLSRECIVVETDEYNLALPPVKQAASPKPAGKKPALAAPLHSLEEAEDERPVTFKPRPLERRGGDALNVLLAFVPTDAGRVEQAEFDAYVVNDSNFFLRFAVLSHEAGACTLLHEDTAEPNTKVLLGRVSHVGLQAWERVTFQAFAYKEGKAFQPKAPVNVGLRVDGTKFFRQHAFTVSDFFREPSLRYALVENDRPVRGVYVEAEEAIDVLVSPKPADRPRVSPARTAAKADPKQPMEVDLHAAALLDTEAGLSPRDILDFQLKTFRETMDAHLRERGKKIVFIHGKGEGVLRAAIVRELKSRYRQCRWQDASFREYGFGATLVTMG